MMKKRQSFGDGMNKYPICPKCGQQKIVGAHMASDDSRSIYCANADCDYDIPFEELTTPIKNTAPIKDTVPPFLDIKVRLNFETGEIILLKPKDPYIEKWVQNRLHASKPSITITL